MSSDRRLNIYFAWTPRCSFKFYKNFRKKSCIFFECLLPHKVSGTYTK